MATLARTFRDLRANRRAVGQTQAVFRLASRFPRYEMAKLSDQLIRSSRAVPALIAEAWGRRHYPRAFSEKLSQALGEATEVQAWLECAYRCDYFSEEDFLTMDREWEQLGGTIRRMMQQATHFSGKRPAEQ